MTSKSSAEQKSNNNLIPAPVLDVLRQSGSPMSKSVREPMESKFGQDLSHVRVHTNSDAAAAANSINAAAFTFGNQIVMGGNRYQNSALGQSLLSHELVHSIQHRPSLDSPSAVASRQNEFEKEAISYESFNSTSSISLGGSTENLVYRQPLQSVESMVSEPVEDAKHEETLQSEQKYESPNEWKIVNESALVEKAGVEGKGGARLRSGPNISNERIKWLPQNTKLRVHSIHSNGWARVKVVGDPANGLEGYVSSSLIVFYRPDPEAILYTVPSGMTLQRLVENDPHFKEYDIRTGDDSRTLAMAVFLVNRESKRSGVYINKAKMGKAENEFDFWGMFDEYSRDTRVFFQSVELVAGKTIWLPGLNRIKEMKDENLLPKRSEWKNAAIAVTKGIGGFAVGVVEGFTNSIVEVFTGLVDLAGTVISGLKSLITGEALDGIKKIINTIREMTDEELKQFFNEAVDAISSMVTKEIEEFKNKWNADSPYKRWNFRGQIIGYLLAEVAMVIFTAGVLTAIKWAGKFTKIGRRLKKVIEVIGKKLKGIIPEKKRKKSKNDKDDKQNRDHGTDPKEKARAIAAAKAIESIHDAKDSPLPVLMASLKTVLKPKYRWIDYFSSQRIGPGRYRIYLHASKGKPVDGGDYTTRDANSVVAATSARHVGKQIYQQLLASKNKNFRPGKNGRIRPDKSKTLEITKDGDILGTYSEVLAFNRSTGLTPIVEGAEKLEAHHLIEKRLTTFFGLDKDKVRSVSLSNEDHKLFTNVMKSKLQYETMFDIDVVYDAHKEMYRELGHPEWVEEIRNYIKKNKTQIKNHYVKRLVPHENDKYEARLKRVIDFLGSI